MMAHFCVFFKALGWWWVYYLYSSSAMILYYIRYTSQLATELVRENCIAIAILPTENPQPKIHEQFYIRHSKIGVNVVLKQFEPRIMYTVHIIISSNISDFTANHGPCAACSVIYRTPCIGHRTPHGPD